MLPEIQKLKPADLQSGTETIEEIISGAGFYLELIQSYADSSEPDFWYDQEEAEWVALISGQAVLEFEDGQLELAAGDSLTIAAHQRHRVISTSVDAVWIALHYVAQAK